MKILNPSELKDPSGITFIKNEESQILNEEEALIRIQVRQKEMFQFVEASHFWLVFF